MNTKYIFAGLSALFLVIGLVRLPSNKIQARIWILIGIIFGLVTTYLFYTLK